MTTTKTDPGGTITMDDARRRATLTVEEAGALVGIGRSAAYAAARTGQLPTVRIGKRLVVPTARLLRLLEGDDSASAAVGDHLAG